MDENEKKRLFDICRRSKLGHYVSAEDRKWAETQYKNNPDEYSKIRSDAVDRAISEYLGPFGVGP